MKSPEGRIVDGGVTARRRNTIFATDAHARYVEKQRVCVATRRTLDVDGAAAAPALGKPSRHGPERAAE